MQKRESQMETGDLRVRRTRKLLLEALLTLTQEKGFDHVTVADITARAMVNRATFYRHYFDKYDMVETYVRELLGSLELPRVEQKSVPLQTLMAIGAMLFQHIYDNAGFYRIMLSKQGYPHLLEYIGDHLDQLIPQHLKSFLLQPEQSTIPLDLCITSVNQTGIATIKWWLKHDLAYPADQVSTWFIQMITPSLSHLLIMQKN